MTRDGEDRTRSARPTTAQALWYVASGVAEHRPEPIGEPRPDEVLVRTLFSGVSRGTERLVISGSVGRSEWERMRAPLQAGAFPFPVKYGYCAAGVVEAGPQQLVGRCVFVLHPHQDWFVAPVEMAVPVPAAVPARRATLAANIETALNALWDSGAGPADRIVVVGAGVVGLLVAYLAARLPGSDVTVIDPVAGRRAAVEGLGATYSCDGSGISGADVVIHTSATAGGLATALAVAGLEATVLELSWYGDRPIAAPLGAAFHSQRLRLISSQVGQVSPSRRPRWTYRRRMEAALALLADPILDGLILDEVAFEDASEQLPPLLRPSASGLGIVLRYPAG
jgi:threonine dehydrogenase-like Zn-dependent dehydrogenase